MAAQYPAHEGLQVVAPDHTRHAPEVYRYHDAAPEVSPQGRVGPEKPASVPYYYQQLQPRATENLKARRWCGLPRRTALVVGAVVLLVTVGAVVGGVAGALVARNSASDSSSAGSPSATSPTAPASTARASTTPSSSASASTSTSPPFPSPTNNILALNCPAINDTQFTVDGASFLVLCLTDFRSGSGNIAQSLEPTINDCIGSCATHNSGNQNANTPCQGLTFGANLTRYGGANCFLKTGPLTRTPYLLDDFQAGAILLG